MSPGSVLFPVSSAGNGGAAVLPALLVRQLRARSAWHVDVCLGARGEGGTPFDAAADAPHYLATDRVPGAAQHPLLKRGRYYGAAWYLRTYRHVLPYLRRLRPDILHIHNAGDLFTWGAVGKLLRIPVLWHVHTYHQKRVSPMHYRLCDHMIFVSDASRAHFERIATLPPRTTVHNGVDIAAFTADHDPAATRASLGLSPDRLTLGYVGQLTARKRPEWAVRTAIDLIAAGHDVQLVVVGEDKSDDGVYATRLERMIDDAGCSDRIRLVGRREDVPRIMSALDLFLFSSEEHGEAFPLVVLEAMAAHSTVVSTRSAGVPEAIIDGETGLLSDPHDYGDFRDRVTLAVRDRALRARLACTASRRARERFSIERCGDEVVGVYERMLRAG